MDIRCPVCGEPWDHDELHNAPKGSVYASKYDNETRRNPGYERAGAAFRSFGCGFFDHIWNGKPLERCNRGVHDTAAAEEAALAYEFLGGDMDAAASWLDG